LAACASITNTEMIDLIERFYHQKMLILAVEKNFRSATLQKACIEKATEKGFLPFASQIFVVHTFVKNF
jgi:hypothetical protein